MYTKIDTDTIEASIRCYFNYLEHTDGAEEDPKRVN